MVLSPRQIKAWRTLRGLRQRDLAVLLGVAEWTVFAWEANRRRCQPILILALKGLDMELRALGIMPLVDRPEIREILKQMERK